MPSAHRPAASLIPVAVAALTVSGIGRAEPPPARNAPGAERAVDFAADVRPILAKHCFSCHGGESKRGGLRLDRKSAAMRGGAGGPAIVPGKAAGSPLIERVTSSDPDAVMPPKGKRLTESEVAILRAWIDRGAAWPDEAAAEPEAVWWSLRPLAKPAPPAPPAPPRPDANPIDAFIAAKLSAKGLTPLPEADRRTLIRRVHFDLTGLPPEPEAVDAFVADPAPTDEAYGRLVDRLLASTAYGERWARHWLDIAHYGDTHGYDKDQPRPNAWPYRDWVIRSLNADKPFDRFAAEQIAGDVLLPGRPDGIEALGFLSAGPWDLIGHAEVPESKIDGKVARHLDRDDMVGTVVNTFLSLTVQCAQCHNHKFDPIRQEDYYALQAVFAALDRADRRYDPDPAVAARRAELESKRSALTARRAGLTAAVSARAGARLAELDARIAAAGKAPPSAPAAKSAAYGWHSRIEPTATPDAPKWVQADLGRPAALAHVVLHPCRDSFNNIGDGFGFPPRFRVEVSDDPEFKSGVAVILDHTAADLPNPGLKPVTADAAGRSARYVRVTATKLAPRLNDFIFSLAELEALDAAGKNLAGGAAVTSLDSIEAPPRWRRENLTDGWYPGLGAGTAAGGPADVAKLRAERDALFAGSATEAERSALAEAERGLAEVVRESAALPPQRVVYCGTVHTGSGNFVGTGAAGGKPRTIRLLPRGDVTRPGKEIAPAALQLLAELPGRFDLAPDHREGERRAALARWVTHRDNPLFWRSVVNRVWRWHFGRGIVESPNDFGRMGQLPTHPELLDWLAADFRDSGASLKRLHRLIVTSAAYRRASSGEGPAAAANARLDADNAFLWRANRRKLEAEAVRDAVLAVAGALDRTPFGPPFRDFAVERPEHSPHYRYDLHDPDDPRGHRRSIYRFLVRSQQQPFMVALDCADPSMQVDKRNETLSALQALALLNNRFMLAMSKRFAARLEAAGPDLPTRLTAAVRLALGRVPTDAELADLTVYAERHGLPNACRVILNLNEFVFVD